MVGLPIKDDGRLKIQTDIENFAKKLMKLTSIKVTYWNENFTSKEADEILIKMNVSRKKRKSFQDMLAEKSVREENEDEEKRREKVLLMLNDLRLDKAEEEQFWLERGEDRVTSSLTDNAVGLTEDDKVEVSRMLATGTMFAVQGAVWNAILLLLTAAGILLFVGRGDVNVATPGATGAIGY